MIGAAILNRALHPNMVSKLLMCSFVYSGACFQRYTFQPPYEFLEDDSIEAKVFVERTFIISSSYFVICDYSLYFFFTRRWRSDNVETSCNMFLHVLSLNFIVKSISKSLFINIQNPKEFCKIGSIGSLVSVTLNIFI